MNKPFCVKASVTLDDYPGISVPAVSAPWTLEGRGFIVLYAFSRKKAAKAGLDAEKLRGFGTMMIVDYSSSDAGPYRELLFIPGKMKSPFGWKHRITRIFVSSMESVVNGRINWAIPKDFADIDFSIPAEDSKRTEIKAHAGGKSFFSAVFRSGGIRFPVSTALLPFPLAQPDGTQWVRTSFSGKGMGRIAKLESLESDASMFPNLEGIKPLLAIEVSPFKIVFPQARRTKLL